MVGTSIADRLAQVQSNITQALTSAGRNPAEVTLVGVSKQKSVQDILQAWNAGLRHVGENYWQEAENKLDQLENTPLIWHFIGHLQSNKARFVVGRFAWIHSVDRLSAAQALSRAADQIKHRQKILVQVNVAGEDSKSGVEPEYGPQLLEALQSLPNLQVDGLMTIPPLTPTAENSRTHFAHLRQLSQDWQKYLSAPHNLQHLSMGTSLDYLVALEEGATMVRVGSDIFGSRN